jgi:cytochrome b involved in lipid metabolism
MGGATPAGGASITASSGAAAKVFSAEEVRAHNTDKSCWLAVHGEVFDVTDFLEEHPGGYDIIVASSGRDATQDFDEIGHSQAARDMLRRYKVGSFAGGDANPRRAERRNARPFAASAVGGSGMSRFVQVLLPLLLVLAAIGINFMSKK